MFGAAVMVFFDRGTPSRSGYFLTRSLSINVRLHGVTRTKMFLQGPFIMDTKSGKLKEIMLELIKECGSSKINKKIM